MVQFLNVKYPHSFKVRSILFSYKCAYLLFFPLIILYFFKRSIKEPSYRLNLKERLGFSNSALTNCIWLHAVSLGEFRASVPLIRELLKRSETIIVTTITPAGREEAQTTFDLDIKAGRVDVVYLPLEYDLSFNKFLNRFKPRFAIILEYELWPVMISSCIRHRVPLVLAQGQYVEKSFSLDKKWPSFRGALFRGFDLILAKSQLHSARYASFCNAPIETMGELRFDQEIPKYQLENAKLFGKAMHFNTSGRLCFCFGSTGPGEDPLLISLMTRLTSSAKAKGIPKPFYVYVPRHKKDFSSIKKELDKSGLIFSERTAVFDKNLKFNILKDDINETTDGLFGDSLGEINFYFQMSDYIFIGNSFNDLGAHNVIEPLALKKSVVVGPSVWGIEYPIVEALDKGIIKKVENIEELYEYWWSKINNQKNAEDIEGSMQEFYRTHSGATKRCISSLKRYGYLK